jgi:CarD family transcriptional regulator
LIAAIKELRSLGRAKRYYVIELLSQVDTTVMVPIQSADDIGLRSPLSPSQLSKVWSVLQDDPEILPSKHDQRYEVIRDKLNAGDLAQIAEAVRDITWRKEKRGYLTIEGKRLYDKGMLLLASEIASIQESDLAAAERQISWTLHNSLA